jgi:hypothetical protein
LSDRIPGLMDLQQLSDRSPLGTVTRHGQFPFIIAREIDPVIQ